jgi:hypothetical protein
LLIKKGETKCSENNCIANIYIYCLWFMRMLLTEA